LQRGAKRKEPDEAATGSEAVADAFENAKALLGEGSSVVVTDIAGAGLNL